MEWVGRRRAGVIMKFDQADAHVLRGLVANVQELVDAPAGSADPLERLLGPGFGTDSAKPEDPALARLLPDAYQGDDEAAGEFRRLTESSLRTHKSETAQKVLDSLPAKGGKVVLDEDTVKAWLTALNDVRLVVGTRLDVTEDMEVPADDDPAAPGYQLYRWLSLLQELLVEALIGELETDG